MDDNHCRSSRNKMNPAGQSLEHVPRIQEGVNREDESHYHDEERDAGEGGLSLCETCKNSSINTIINLSEENPQLTQKLRMVGGIQGIEVLSEKVLVRLA